MFLYTLLITLFALLGVFLILLILVQKGKSSMGLGNLGGGSQMLFGGSGGQDLFQKTTWVLGTLFMVSSLVLAMIKRPSSSDLLGSLAQTQAAKTPVMPQALPAQTPSAQTSSAQAAQGAATAATGTPATTAATQSAPGSTPTGQQPSKPEPRA